MESERPVLVVAGPTASGKSALALEAAREFNGIIINADSMQVHEGLHVLTARPGAEDEALAPHRLYGVVKGGETCSAADWRHMAEAEIRAAWREGRLPVVAGGTGLYLRALMEGLSDIPEIPEAVRTETRALFAELSKEAFHARLAGCDPEMAARLNPSDGQRLMRAYEVFQATGRSLADWQREPSADQGLQARFLILVLLPPREKLYAACDARLLAMMERGALDEVRALEALNLDPSLPVMKALGVPELRRHLAGELTLQEAVAATQMATRRYAKRQCTWFRNQLTTAHVFPEQYSESLQQKIFPIIRRFLLTEGL